MRNLASACLQFAKELVFKNDEASAKYACLELRFCIEYITYSQLQIYLDEVPDSTMRKWTPRQVISDLLTVDPDADTSVVSFAGIQEASGMPASNMDALGEDRRFSLKWANKQHNALGNFLHAPTLHQIAAGDTPTKEKMLQKAREVIDEIEQILASQLFNAKLNFYCGTFECKFCKAEVKYGAENINKGMVVCSNCKGNYDLALAEENRITIRPKEVTYKCLSCKNLNTIGFHLMYLDNILTCTNCDAIAKIQYTISPV
ncbi:hypothetical protein ANRL3_01782 [Anaerolineae bacterium]|nr:hypothetical protein ANRL3_01782 [Anaerolineae bacterium]